MELLQLTRYDVLQVVTINHDDFIRLPISKPEKKKWK